MNLKISPDEQLGMMSKLYFDQLPFQKYAQEMVSNMMLQEDDSLYKFSYTTGTGLDEKNQPDSMELRLDRRKQAYLFLCHLYKIAG